MSVHLQTSRSIFVRHSEHGGTYRPANEIGRVYMSHDKRRVNNEDFGAPFEQDNFHRGRYRRVVVKELCLNAHTGAGMCRPLSV
jgi:hypothetical protein